jgi:hypothetical protein
VKLQVIILEVFELEGAQSNYLFSIALQS